MRPVHRSLAVVAALMAATACARHKPGEATPDPGPTVIVFSNASQDQADVYAQPRGGDAFRLGTVPAGRTDTLKVPVGAVGPGASVNFIARLLARSAVVRSGPISLQPGDWLAIMLPPSQNILSVLPAR